MKASLVMYFILAVVGIEAGFVPLAGAQKEKASQIAVDCIKETGVNPELVAKVKKGHLSDDENLKKFTLCFFQKAAIIGPDGKLNMETALAKLPPGIDKAEFTKVLQECKNKKGQDATDTAYEIFKCYHAGTKTHIML